MQSWPKMGNGKSRISQVAIAKIRNRRVLFTSLQLSTRAFGATGHARLQKDGCAAHGGLTDGELTQEG